MKLKKSKSTLSIACIFFFFLLAITFFSAPEKYDIIIKNTKIVDGTGKAALRGDIAIKGEKIVAVGRVEGEAATVIDGSGLVTCPGFIDPHSHADLTIVKYPLAENLIMQGITTFLGGNCGGSAAPQKDLTFGEWLSKVEDEGISINYAPLVGHYTIRILVMGHDYRRKATPAEIEQTIYFITPAMLAPMFTGGGGIGVVWMAGPLWNGCLRMSGTR